MSPAALRVYLGAAPGVGKTFRMLEEGHRRLARGTDVVVAAVDSRGRPQTEAAVEGLELMPGARRGLDVEAVLVRRPSLALVDDLARRNPPGARNPHRWQDVQELLDAGIGVVTTVNVEHLASLGDVVRAITGVEQRDTVPDAVVRGAAQVELVDMAPEALRRRLAHGNVYRPEEVDAALRDYFRLDTLTALRELALLWLAGKVDEQLDRYREQLGTERAWEARERVVVGLGGGPEGDDLVRRAARVAARARGADLLAVHVARTDALAGAEPGHLARHLARQRLLVEELGGSYHQVVGTDVPRALLDVAGGMQATQLVIGTGRRGRLARLLRPGVAARIVADAGAIDVHVVTHAQEADRVRPAVRIAAGLGARRRRVGLGLALIGLPLLSLALSTLRPEVGLSSDILAFLAAVVVVALVGGALPAVVAALLGFGLLNYFFTPPLHEFTIARRENVFALLVYVAVAVAVSSVVDLAARRTGEASRARAEAETLSTLAGSVLRGRRPLLALLEQVRETFALDGVSLLERGSADRPWRVAARAGDAGTDEPETGDAGTDEPETEVRVDDASGAATRLVLHGRPLPAADRRLLEAFAAQAAVALRQERLAAQAAEVEPLTEVDRLRTALLNAVSHDLRTPLATAKTSVGGLRSAGVRLSDADREELLAAADDALDRLERLVDNLLDLSRLEAGVLPLSVAPVSPGEVVSVAVDQVGRPARDVAVVGGDDVEDVLADPALLERALVNLVANAVRHSPPDVPPVVRVSEHAGRVEIRVVDRGPGVPAADWDQIFLPFQRLGDRETGHGVGLGLALSRGLVEAMGGTLSPEDTPGGGLTMTVSLPVAPGPDREVP